MKPRSYLRSFKSPLILPLFTEEEINVQRHCVPRMHTPSKWLSQAPASLWSAPLGCVAGSLMPVPFSWLERKLSDKVLCFIYVTFVVSGIADPQHCSTFLLEWVFIQTWKADEQNACWWDGPRPLTLPAVLMTEYCQTRRGVCVCVGGGCSRVERAHCTGWQPGRERD